MTVIRHSTLLDVVINADTLFPKAKETPGLPKYIQTTDSVPFIFRLLSDEEMREEYGYIYQPQMLEGYDGFYTLMYPSLGELSKVIVRYVDGKFSYCSEICKAASCKLTYHLNESLRKGIKVSDNKYDLPKSRPYYYLNLRIGLQNSQSDLFIEDFKGSLYDGLTHERLDFPELGYYGINATYMRLELGAKGSGGIELA